jgi:hypothetical protein
MQKECSRNGLDHHRGRREQAIRHDDRRRGPGNVARVLGGMRHHHEEGDADAGAEDHDRAEHVEIFEGQIRHRGFAPPPRPALHKLERR